MKRQIILLLITLNLVHADLKLNPRISINELDHELIFYSQHSDVFYNNDGNIQKIGTGFNGAGILKYDDGTFYFSDEKSEAYKFHLNEKTVQQVKMFSKPIDTENPRRQILNIDELSSVALLSYELIDLDSLRRIYTNFSSSEKFYSIASDEKNVYIGTAVNGLYWAEKKKPIAGSGEKHWYFRSLNSGLPYIPFEEGLSFYEEIHSLHVAANGDLYAGTGIYGGVYLKRQKSSKFEPLPWPDAWKTSDVNLITTGKNGEIWVSCSQGMVVYKKDSGKPDKYEFQTLNWSDLPYKYEAYMIQSKLDRGLIAKHVIYNNTLSKEKEIRMQSASDKRLFYSSPYNIRTKFSSVMNLLESKNFDGIVLDVKDDQGYILYNSELPLAKQMGAIRPVFDIRKTIRLIHEKKKYVAVRIVVFKDPVLFENQQYAIWDKTSNTAWIGNPRERWLDPYNPALADNYYVPLVRELTNLGVDEIQLDYIRFPSDGMIENCLFRYKKGNKYYSEAIEDFLFKIRQATSLPLSLDIYGYQGLYRTGGTIGQDMEVFGKYADVISPMLYSSHFGNLYMTDIEKDKRVYRLIKHSIRRAEFISQNRFLIRPYLQAFPMKSSIWGYGDKYFADQIQANADEHGNGYSFWGSIEHMQALDKSLSKRISSE